MNTTAEQTTVDSHSQALSKIAGAAARIAHPIPLVALIVLLAAQVGLTTLWATRTSMTGAHAWFVLALMAVVFAAALFFALRAKGQDDFLRSPPFIREEKPFFEKVPEDRTLWFALYLVDVSDYEATVERLRRRLPSQNNLALKSFTILGLYGENDLLIELISDTERAGIDVEKELRKWIETDREDIITIHELGVEQIAILNKGDPGSTIGEQVHALEVRDGEIQGMRQLPKLKSEYLKGDTVEGGLLNAHIQQPFLIAYVWVMKMDVSEAAETGLNDMYGMMLRTAAMRKGIYGLYKAKDALILKVLYPLEEYYKLTELTRRLDSDLRRLGHANHLRVRTACGAEVVFMH